MPYTLYNGSELPNIVTVAKRLDPNGKIATIAELLAQYNPILEDIPMVEGNLPVGHRHTIRSGICTPTWRRLNYGVRPTVSGTIQVDDTTGMLEDYSEVDKDLATLNGNSAEFRMSEDEPHIEGMSTTMAKTIFYGDTAVNPERFLGIAPRYDSFADLTAKPAATTDSAYLKQIIDMGGTGAALTSVYLISWGKNTVFGLYPKGSKVGLSTQNLGEVTLFDNDGGRFQGYRTHYQWKMGLAVKDWRYIVRIANINLAKLDDTAYQISLYKAFIKATHTLPSANLGRPVFYCGQAVSTMLDLAAVEKANVALTMSEVFGRPITAFRGIPIRHCNAILETEAQVI